MKAKNISKKLLLFVLVVYLSVVKAQTNVYHPFPESNATWCDTTCGSCSYTLAGDTVVNNSTYHKIHRSCVLYQVGVSGGCEYPSNGGTLYTYIGYTGAIRQDTMQRKVYLLLPNSTTDTLLYDFSLAVGDTIKAYVMSGSVVTSIDSILIGTQYRKIWATSIPYTNGIVQYLAKVIEGIGGTLGLLNTYPEPDQRLPKLYCFSQNNQTLYPYYSANSTCAQVTSGIANFKADAQTTIYPNPTTGYFVIEPISNTKSLNLTRVRLSDFVLC